jgi:hypothetical protein
VAAEQRHLAGCSDGGHLHVAAALPEGRVVALVSLVVQDDEVADALVLEADLAVELVDVGRLEAAVGEEGRSSRAMAVWIRWMLVDSSGSRKPLARPMATTLRFQPCLRMPVHEADQARLGQRLAVQVGQQGRRWPRRR